MSYIKVQLMDDKAKLQVYDANSVYCNGLYV